MGEAPTFIRQHIAVSGLLDINMYSQYHWLQVCLSTSEGEECKGCFIFYRSRLKQAIASKKVLVEDQRGSKGRVCVCTRSCVCACVCMHTCLCVRVRVHARVCVCARMRMCVHVQGNSKYTTCMFLYQKHLDIPYAR